MRRVNCLAPSYSMGVWGDTLSKQYDLQSQVYHQDAPTMFFGCYTQRDLARILQHRGSGIMVWAGSDAMVYTEAIEVLRVKDNLKHIAISHWIDKKLTARGIPHEYLVIPLTDMSLWWPDEKMYEEEEKLIYCYAPNNKTYRRFMLREVADKLPGGFGLVVVDNHTQYTKVELQTIYRKCFVGIRLTWWDGAAASAQELGLSGRRTIWNGQTPYSIGYTNVDSIVAAVLNEAENQPDQFEIAEATRSFLHTDQDWLNVE